MTKTEVEVDAVLSADVGDAPMRQRQYTAPVGCAFCVRAACGAKKHYPQQVAKWRATLGTAIGKRYGVDRY